MSRFGADLALLVRGGFGVAVATSLKDTTDFDAIALMLNKECEGRLGSVSQLEGASTCDNEAIIE